MAEAAQVRLVRCPRCGNLLTELPDVYLYKCGGCGVVLKARKKGIFGDELSGTSDDVKGARIPAEAEHSLLDMPSVGMESIEGIERARMERLNNQRDTSDDSSSYRPENTELLTDFDVNHRRKARIRRHAYYDEDNQVYSQGPVHSRIHDGHRNFSANISEYAYFQGEQRRSDNLSYHDVGSSSYEPRSPYEHIERLRYQDRDLNARVENLEHNRVELLKKLDELKDHLSHSGVIEHQTKERILSPNVHDPHSRFHDVYVQESHYVSKKPLESSYLDHLHGQNPIPGRYVSGVQSPYSPRDFSHEFKGHASPWNQHHPKDFFGYTKNIDHESSLLHSREQFFHEPSCSCYQCYNRNLDIPPKIDHNLLRNYNAPRDDNFRGSGTHSRQSPNLNPNYQELENDGFNEPRYRKARVAHRRGRVWHPVSGGAPFLTCCNCFELLKLPRKYGSLTKKQQIKCGSCFSVILFELGSKGNAIPVAVTVDPVSTHVKRSSNDADSDVCYIKREDSKVPFSTESKPKCNESEKRPHPASFISALSLNELGTGKDKKSNYDEAVKQLDPISTPSSTSMDEHSSDRKKMLAYDEMEKHLDPFSAKSGVSVVKSDANDDFNFGQPEKHPSAFSAVSSSTVHEPKTVAKLSSDNQEMQVDIVSDTSIASLDKFNVNTHKKSNYDQSERQFDPAFPTSNISLSKPLTDSELNQNHDGLEKQLDPISASLNFSVDQHCTNTDEKSNYGKFGRIDDHLSSNSSFSVDDQPIENVTSKKDCNLPQEFPNPYFKNSIVSPYDKENDEKQDVPMRTQNTSWENPDKDSKEKNVSSMPVSRFSNSFSSQDSVEIREQVLPRTDIGSKPFTAGVAKESVQGISNFNESSEFKESNVFVNGQFIQYHDVKNAEKLAGPIQPGHYWYDYRAGFWGVMGHPCLGIVMPNIEEFNYPLPENCAAGNTGVFINGRELHQKDLDILASRGLPILKYRFYNVAITGKVVDERTGEELDLGKLAPTVEREQRGFGMRVP